MKESLFFWFARKDVLGGLCGRVVWKDTETVSFVNVHVSIDIRSDCIFNTMII